MAELFREYAGEMRRFALRTGDVFDIEEACGKVGIGAIFRRLGSHEYFLRDILNVIKFGLIGGGMPRDEAARMTRERIDAGNLVEQHALALDIMLAQMESVKPGDDAKSGDGDSPYDVGAILRSFLQAGISPGAVRDMRYSDFVNILLATSGKEDGVEPPSEEEFLAMLKRLEETGA